MKKALIVIVCALGLGFIAPPAGAVVLDETTSAYYVGFIFTGIPPAEQFTYLQTLIGLAPGAEPITIDGQVYDRLGSSLDNLPAPNDGVKINVDPAKDIDFELGGLTYLLGKYDGPNAGTWVWLASGSVTLPGWDPVEGKYGLSNYAMFGVPEGAMTLVLLSGALVGLEALRRRFRA